MVPRESSVHLDQLRANSSLSLRIAVSLQFFFNFSYRIYLNVIHIINELQDLAGLRNATWLNDYFIWYMDLNHGQRNLLKISQVKFVK